MEWEKEESEIMNDHHTRKRLAGEFLLCCFLKLTLLDLIRS